MDTRGGSDNENDQLPRTTLAVVIEHTSTCNSNMKYVSLAINYISIGNVWKCCPVLWRRNYIPTHFSRSWCWSSLWSCCNNHFKSITKEQRLLQKECSITHGSNILRSTVPAISIHQNQCWQLWPIISSNATFQIRNFLLTTSVEKKHLLINLDSKLVLLSVLWWVIFNPCCPNTFCVCLLLRAILCDAFYNDSEMNHLLFFATVHFITNFHVSDGEIVKKRQTLLIHSTLAKIKTDK